MRFQGKVAVVTGGATGIGRETAIAFAREGAAVVVADVNEREAQTTLRQITEAAPPPPAAQLKGDARAAELAGRGRTPATPAGVAERGGRGRFVRLDVSKAGDWSKAVDETVKTFGRLDILFNNAGIGGDLAPTGDYKEESFDRVLAVNLKGVWLGMRAVIPQMLRQQAGVIVNNASILGMVGFANAPAYVAAKHGILGLTKTAALEYAAAGIRVNAVCPGFIKTPMVQDGLTPEAMTQIAQLHALGRLGDPDEVSRVVLFLASEESSFITGAAYLVDGGYTAR
ncbi:MAG TPA: SDR family oxidoreductase [bacterium]|nr:SDR family oxidoreductase [bacterium]